MGPTGSVGFEFASGAEVVTTTSDLDVLIRLSSCLSVEQAQLIVNQLKECPVSVDVQVETEKGAFSLVEYARGEKTLLLRTVYGPSLVKTESISIKDGKRYLHLFRLFCQYQLFSLLNKRFCFKKEYLNKLFGVNANRQNFRISL